MRWQTVAGEKVAQQGGIGAGQDAHPVLAG
jgi:hypothetical protein